MKNTNQYIAELEKAQNARLEARKEASSEASYGELFEAFWRKELDCEIEYYTLNNTWQAARIDLLSEAEYKTMLDECIESAQTSEWFISALDSMVNDLIIEWLDRHAAEAEKNG